LRNQQIRDYVIANDKILYDFADIESWDPDGAYYGDRLVTDACNYDSDGDGDVDIYDRNWAIDWQNNPSHKEGVDWYDCSSAHSEPLNANQKAYAAWALWTQIAAARPLLGDVNLDEAVNGLDVEPFVAVLLSGLSQAEADMNQDGVVNGLDVDLFVDAVIGTSLRAVPEPNTTALAGSVLFILIGANRRRRRGPVSS
jgi:hypothetical protein